MENLVLSNEVLNRTNSVIKSISDFKYPIESLSYIIEILYDGTEEVEAEKQANFIKHLEELKNAFNQNLDHLIETLKKV